MILKGEALSVRVQGEVHFRHLGRKAQVLHKYGKVRVRVPMLNNTWLYNLADWLAVTG